MASVCQGLATANDARFVRFTWEAPPTEWAQEVRKRRWAPFEKGGGYGKWFGHHYWVVDWQESGARIKQTPGPRVQNEQHYFKEGWTYSYMARGSIGARVLLGDSITCDLSAGVFARSNVQGLESIGLCLNNRLASYIVRSTSAKVQLRESYVARIPIVDVKDDSIRSIQTVQNLRRNLVERCINERNFNGSSPTSRITGGSDALIDILCASALLHSLEGASEKNVMNCYGLSAADISAVTDETGIPASWHPLIARYEAVPSFSELHEEVTDAVGPGAPQPDDDLRSLKLRLRALYEAGPGGEVEQYEVAGGDDEDEEESLAGARIPIPAETFLEELSQKLEIHPISVYWLLKEGIEKEGWRCIPEEQRFVTDQLTVTILRLLGHRWPRQVEAGEAVPEWADQDGIIPITAGTQEATLSDRVRARIAADFPGGDVASIEREFAEIMGKPLDRWLETEFFKHHTQQFKKRPIAWQLQSSKFTAKRKPAFACLLYYHKLDGDTLPKLRSQYVGPLRQRLETELRGIEAVPKDSRSDRQTNRLRELADQLSELRDFDKGLEHVQSSGFAFAKLAEQLRAEPIDALCSPDGIRPPPSDHADFLRQEQSYLPDINDGVRVNIAPLQQAGLLAADVLAGKDLDKAITDRATWRSDERRWSRSGKLPQPGYFRVKPQDTEDDTGLTTTTAASHEGIANQVAG